LSLEILKMSIETGATRICIKNSHIEGRVRKTAELYEEKAEHDLPNRTNYRIPRTIINHTEYSITLADEATGNTISSYGPVKGDTQRNLVQILKMAGSKVPPKGYE